MILQNILFPTQEICSEQTLYYRSEARTVPDMNDGCLPIQAGESYSFDTYFNSFSAGKWFHYTKIKAVSLRLMIKGVVQIVLMQKFLPGQMQNLEIHRLGIYTCQNHTDQPREVTIPFPADCRFGMLYFTLNGLSEGACLCGGSYVTDLSEKEAAPVKLALDICTFRREQFVARNIRLLKAAFLENPQSHLQDKLTVFIADNAGTLDRERFCGEHIRIFKNSNTGGSGGFTRGMMEILKEKEHLGITHVLVMDDDILIEPESIFRTCVLLEILKEDYQAAFIGGGMLVMDKQYLQVESGARWHSGEIESLKCNLDLRQCQNCLENERVESADYQAWWYCVMPVSVITEQNLPLPLFIRGDDVEFGLRNMERLILMNGICVWHESFEKKYASSVFYYIIRNQLIVNAVHGKLLPRRVFYKKIFRHALGDLLLYRYDNVDIIIDGIYDYYKGPNWLEQTNAAALHQTVSKKGYRMVCLDQLEFRSDSYTVSQSQYRRLKKITLNGLLLPATHQAAVPLLNADFLHAFRAKRLLNYDADGNGGFLTQRSMRRAVQCFWKLLKLYFKTLGYYRKIGMAYQKRSAALTSDAFWRQYFKNAEK